ncbi:TPR-like protein [Suillus ampliporus]|nr:TPR-like protein [Suillus ampliporus]
MSNFVLNHLDDPLPPLDEEPSHPEHSQDLGDVHMIDIQQVTITSILATGLSLGLRRIPAGFYVTVQADGTEWRTSNKPVNVNQDVVEWDERILLPSEPSSNIRLSVHASFELGPMLGHGDLLRTFEITVGELLDRSGKSQSIVFQARAGEVVSSCTSLFATVQKQRSDENNATVLCPVTPFMTSDMHALVLETDAGHRLLARYLRTQNNTNLDQSIKHFERASDLCPVDHPCRPAALFNLATAKFVCCQARRTYPDLDIPISLFQDALDMRPTGHPDRPVTQVHLSMALLSRFTRRSFQTDADAAEELLHEILDVCHANSHIYRAALLAIETSALHPAGSIDVHDRGQQWPIASILPWSPDELARRTELCLQRDDPHALDEVISSHYNALEYYSPMHAVRGQLLGNLCTMLFTRFQHRGNSIDLDRSIGLQREALDLSPVGHPDRSSLLNNLAIGLSTRFSHRGNDQDVNEAIVLHREALASRPVGHPDRSSSLNNLAIGLSTRFKHRGNDQDLNEAIVLDREALASRPVGHPDRSRSFNNLANQLFTRFSYRSNDQDLDEAIVLHRKAVALLPVDHPARSGSLNNLANGLSTRFKHRGNDQDLDEAIMLDREAMALRPVNHPARSASLNNLANGLSTRFSHRGNDQDLDEAIVLHREAMALLPVGHPDRTRSFNNLANRLFIRFSHRGNDQDLDEAIVLHREALALRPVGHPARSGSLHNLASGLSTRFSHRGNDQDLDEAIVLHREVMALLSVGHPDRFALLNNLGSELSTRFSHRGNDQDLDEAIVLHREALALLPVGHSDRSTSLNNLASGLYTRFSHRGNDQDLDEAIVLHREALALRPVGHPDRSASTHNLASGLSTHFSHRGNDQDLDEAIVLHREALALCPVGHPDRSSLLNNLANGLSTCFSHRGNDQDLDEAIMLHREALALRPVGHPDRSASLNNLANGLSTRFSHRGNDQDLDEDIVLHREALALLPVGHPDRSGSFNNLAIGLSTRFSHRGNDQDLDEAIMLHREALALLPVGHSDRSKSFNNLASGLYTRFSHRGNDQDLDETIILHREALALRPVGHPDRSASLHNLASGLSTHFSHRGNDQDLDEAIMLHREALALLPVGHSDRSKSFNNLASGLEALALRPGTLALRPVGHPDLSGSFHNLAIGLSTRFSHRGNGQDLNDSLEHLRSALTLLTQHDPHQLLVHQSLADVYLLFHRSGVDLGTGQDTDSLNAAIVHLKAAANFVSGSLRFRLQASLSWVRHAAQHAHGTQLEAYSISMHLLNAYMSTTASVSSRHNAMKDFPSTLAVDAASCALRHDDVCRAVELLEQGRTLIWTQMARFRTPLDSLEERGDHPKVLMKRFRDLSSLLDKPPTDHSEATLRVDVEAEATRYRRLVEGWNTTVEEIRKVEGFAHFLLPPLFSDIQDAARDGPIIVLIASKSSCDAIIVPHHEPPVSVRLAINATKLVRLANALQRTVQKGAGPQEKQAKLIQALRELWVEVVHPVVQHLDTVAKPGSRIWWCPTSFFNFLPLHAAGEYRSGGKSLSQLYISSYTPSLTALIKARRSHDRSLPMSFAAIGQNHPPEHKFPLTCVEPELDLVQSLLPPSPTVSFTKVTSVESTKSTALRTLRDNHWIHFACHGTQNFVEPFKSAFLMRDQPLQLLDISHTDLSRHEFAFLSACETAVGHFTTPDEVIHLAAGLQFSGVKSVVGTFWNVNDVTVQRLVEAFYKNFCGDGKMNSKRAARALHRAVQMLAGDKDMPLDQRIVFMHIGV